MCVTERALLSRFAEQRKSICHREQVKVRAKKDRETQGEGQRELVESSFCLTSHPLTVFPSSLPGRQRERKKEKECRDTERELNHARSLAQDSGIPGPLELCTHTH